jgi:hypothetical protein
MLNIRPAIEVRSELEAEYFYIRKRVKKLRTFLKSYNVDVPADNKFMIENETCLRDQLKIMEDYMDILAYRIKDLDVEIYVKAEDLK